MNPLSVVVLDRIDFDDCCWGATIVDISIALMELSMFKCTEMNAGIARSLIQGYLYGEKRISILEKSLILNAIEMTCAVWLGFNIAQAPHIEQANVNLQRLNLLRDREWRLYFDQSIQNMFDNYMYLFIDLCFSEEYNYLPPPKNSLQTISWGR